MFRFIRRTIIHVHPISRLLEEAGVCTWDRHFSLVTPRDFLEYEKKVFEEFEIFEGSLYELTAMVGGRRMVHRRMGNIFLRPAYAGAAYLKHFLRRGV